MNEILWEIMQWNKLQFRRKISRSRNMRRGVIIKIKKIEFLHRKWNKINA